MKKNVNVYSGDDQIHRRRNALTGEWVLVSPHRAKRPWQGQTEAVQTDNTVYDEHCPLCPGNVRAGGESNPHYSSTFVFKNDFAALNEAGDPFLVEEPLFQARAEKGEARVLCYSPNHSLSLAEMCEAEIFDVIQLWIEQLRQLGRSYPHVQIFENKGAVMGCSMPHPHGQVWAQSHEPSYVARERIQQQAYWQQHGRPLLLDYARQESEQESRSVAENQSWLVVVPYWAAWPYETLLLPKFAVSRMDQLSREQCRDLAAILKILLVRYDNLFNTRFPYSMGWHMAPSDGEAHSEWQLHAHFYPPLLRSATVKKFMVGYEMLAEPQRDITAEQAAQQLKQQSTIHFRESTHV